VFPIALDARRQGPVAQEWASCAVHYQGDGYFCSRPSCAQSREIRPGKVSCDEMAEVAVGDEYPRDRSSAAQSCRRHPGTDTSTVLPSMPAALTTMTVCSTPFAQRGRVAGLSGRPIDVRCRYRVAATLVRTGTCRRGGIGTTGASAATSLMRDVLLQHTDTQVLGQAVDSKGI